MGGLTAQLAPEAQPSGEQDAVRISAPPLAGLFRFGGLVASIRSNDAAFASRFRRIFVDCLESGSIERPASELTVLVDEARVEARITGHRELDVRVASALLPGVQIRCSGETLSVPSGSAWPIFFAHYFVHHVMSLQRDMLFLHGATVDVRGRGMFLGGDKGAGKSTLALALGCRGHGVLGDEVAAIRVADRMCLPFRRAVSVREGPQAPPIVSALESGAEAERLADGTTRRRLSLSRLFHGSSPSAVPLQTAVFLRGFGSRREVERFDFSAAHAAWVGPLHATFAGRSTGEAALELVRLFSRLRCYRVTIAGAPEELARDLETIAEDAAC